MKTAPPTVPPTSETPPLSRRQFLQRNLALLGVVALREGMGEPNAIQVTRHRLVMPGLRAPMRIAQLTDLHRSWCISEGFIARVVAQTNSLRPDLILLTGDFVTRHSAYAESCAARLAELRAPLGLYATLGNHDYWCDKYTGSPKVIGNLNDAKIQMLTNRNTCFENGLWLVGLDDIWAGIPDLKAGFSGVPAHGPVLAMTHNPNLFLYLRDHDCVTLVGHTHGGQINIPFITPLVVGPDACKRGWYRHPSEPGRMYVSRGLGMVGVPLRFASLPEIALFDVVPA